MQLRRHDRTREDSAKTPTGGPVSPARTGVGSYTGSFQAPKATGTLTFTGFVEGYGLYATEVPTTVSVGS